MTGRGLVNLLARDIGEIIRGSGEKKSASLYDEEIRARRGVLSRIWFKVQLSRRIVFVVVPYR